MRRLKILHVEENREDALLLARACKVAELPADFYEVRRGTDAVAYLRGESIFSDRANNPFPDIVILDLNLEGLNGFDFLHWLRKESEFPSLPVLVFTDTRDAAEKERIIAHGASGYFAKPVEFDSLVRLAECFKEFGRIDAN
jgi:CheY-like chemotaxis protein